MRMQVKLEIGHKAACRESPTSEGFTHDWTVFVRGSEGKDISHFVEKVVFHLHESFPKSKRAVKEPPYKVDECGYGSFELKIEVCFKTKDEPRRVTFTYDLFLPLLGYPPVSNVRTEALTFTHPTEDFMKKLIKGGGIQISSANGVSGTSLSNGHGNILKDETKETVQKSASISDTDKGKKMKVPKAASKPTAMVGMKRSPPSNENSATDGPSVKKKKKKKKSSEGTSSSSKSKQPVLEQNAANTPTSLPVAADVKDLKVKFKSVPTKEGEKRKEHHSTDSHQKPKVSSHGSHSSHASHTSKGKEMKGHSEHALSSESKPKGDSNDHKTKEKRKAEKLKKKSTSDKKEKKEKKGKKTVEKVTIRRNSGDSWASSGSSCGLMSNVVNKNKALGKLLSEMSDEEDEDLGESLPTPFKREPSPALPKAVVKEQCTGDLEKTSDPNTSKHKAKENKPRISASIIDNSGVDCVMNGTGETLTSEVGETKKSTTYVKNSSPRRNEEKNGLHKLSRKELYDLYDFITNCRDSSSLQKVVDVIETTGLYTVAEKTFEFDLCCLEKTTLRKIQKCLGLR